MGNNDAEEEEMATDDSALFICINRGNDSRQIRLRFLQCQRKQMRTIRRGEEAREQRREDPIGESSRFHEIEARSTRLSRTLPLR